MRTLVVVVLVAFAVSCSKSRRISHLEMGDIPIDQTVLTDYEKQYGEYDCVYLDIEQTIDHYGGQSELGGGGFKTSIVMREQRLVLNPDNAKMTTFELDVPKPLKIEKMVLRMTSPEGRVEEFGAHDVRIDDSRNVRKCRFVYPHVEKGTVIEEGIEARSDVGLLALDRDIQLQYENPCKRIVFKYAYPAWWKIQIKNNSTDLTGDYVTVYNDQANKRILTYTAKDVPGFIEEPYSPDFRAVADYLHFRVTEAEMHTLNYYHAMKDWQEFAGEFRRYVLKKDWFNHADVEKQTGELITDSDSPDDKVYAIINYINENILISDDAGNENLKTILKKGLTNRFGATALVRAMLINAGLDADFLLIHSANDGEFDHEYISFSQYRTPGVRVIVRGESRVLFPFLTNLPIYYIPAPLQGQPALVIRKENSETQYWDMPEIDQLDNTARENYQLNLSADGAISVTEEKSLLGGWAYFVRDVLAELDETEQLDAMSDLMTYEGGEVLLESCEIQNLKDCDKPLTVRLKYTIDNLLTVTPEEIVLRTAGLFSPVSLHKFKIDTSDRRNPIAILADEEYLKHITILYPKEWSVETDFSDVQFKNEFGHISGRYEIGEGQIIVEQSRVLKKCKEPKEKIADLLAITGNVSQLDIPTIIFGVNEGQ